MPRNFDLFPTKGQVSHYIDMYIAQHNLASIMRLATAVTCMRPRSDGSGSAGWSLTLNGSRQESFDHVVVCTGSCSKPCIPEIKGKEAFEAAGGLCLHSSQLLDRSLLQGRRVVVVGFGQSALEVASLAAAPRRIAHHPCRPSRHLEAAIHFARPRLPRPPLRQPLRRGSLVDGTGTELVVEARPSRGAALARRAQRQVRAQAGKQQPPAKVRPRHRH
ncbi:hypothetical protein L7F22_047189 [Adiantum nelumboides]|nr:hypothetical protein [Adiantum nelumboides]